MIFKTGLGTLCAVLMIAAPTWAKPIEKEQALALALENNPRLSAALARVEGVNGERLQASLMPNPQAAIELENFAGDNEMSGFDSVETTIGLEQEIEIGGKRTKRTEIADYELQITQQQAIAEAMSLLAETDYAFMRVAIAQDRLALANKRLQLADKTHEAVKKRVNAAAASDIQHTKADIEQSAAQIEKGKAESELIEAQNILISLTGVLSEREVQADILTLPSLPDRQVLLDEVKNTPQTRANEFAKLRAASHLNLVQAQAIPNPTIGFGIRHFNENNDTALVAGLSFPIPVFDRNQGGIQTAKAEIIEADALARQQDLNLKQSAIKAWEQMATAYNEVEAYQADVIPSAEKAYAQASDGYNTGRFSFLDLLDAQRTLYEVQEAQLDSLLSLYEAKAQTDFLMNTYKPLTQNMLNGDVK